VAADRIEGVRFFPACAPEEACDYYALASAAVLPSYFGETWGLVVNEAMACGLPVLVSNQCGCAQSLVRQGLNGYTFSPSDSSELATFLARISALNDDQLRRMGDHSREIVAGWSLERFAQEAMAAVSCCFQGTRRRASFVDRLLLRAWHGRYRPG
jgi:glycosyltransferase involved in cell wall biosynthesis